MPAQGFLILCAIRRAAALAASAAAALTFVACRDSDGNWGARNHVEGDATGKARGDARKRRRRHGRRGVPVYQERTEKASFAGPYDHLTATHMPNDVKVEKDVPGDLGFLN